MSGAARIEELRAAARYARQRRDLYVARVNTSRPTSAAKLRDLERACDAAEDRLKHAEAEFRRPENDP